MNIFENKRREIYKQLCAMGIEEAESEVEARLILEHITGLKLAQQLISNSCDWQENWQKKIEHILSARQKRRPLAYCLGETGFAGLKFKIYPGVLIPRVDTETLVETVINLAQKYTALKIAEIGVGSGAIIISLLKRLPQSTAWACDISQPAISTTKENAQLHGVMNRLTLLHGDWQKVLPNEQFDIIVSNPPYIPLSCYTDKTHLQPEIYFEPQEALFAGEDGLDFYRKFAQTLGNRCKIAVFEIGDTQEQAVFDIFKKANWQKLQIVKDVNGLARVLIAFSG